MWVYVTQSPKDHFLRRVEVLVPSRCCVAERKEKESVGVFWGSFITPLFWSCVVFVGPPSYYYLSSGTLIHHYRVISWLASCPVRLVRLRLSRLACVASGTFASHDGLCRGMRHPLAHRLSDDCHVLQGLVRAARHFVLVVVPSSDPSSLYMW